MIRARVDPKLQEAAESIFESLGLTVTQAITLFYQQVKWQKGLPFAVRMPNEITRRTFDATDAGEDIVRATDADDLFDKLGI
jgi:DNA-damage-inducible protein J